ncbi:D-amino acid dehydrogenase [Pigmentiphaga litoralis]|uniref:D-amino-acid dehydrogenase n=1 Tax=Pigmentiphaga litoralis TaxID=516702 RepID=A0A7Y9LMV7_9BURK|nr:D-amino acid dehydrogenase [Pigmentiphaga litoralis]NYE26214.1 D-amino-acid dehydrogenase [Pigmentiphaga litoralis]NYE85334.1 D-amino-acid dehydrogenase [Pigmentiphaga litoralis]
MSRIAIIGAGITGVTSAYALSKLGHDVTVIDRHRYAAMETSFANGGQLSASNAEVWNHRSTLVKGLKWMTQRNAPLLFNPLPSWHKYTWVAQFLSHIRDYRSNTIATTRLAIESRKHLYQMAADEGIEFDLEQRGILHIYHDKASFDAAGLVNQLLVEGGLERYAVTSAEARAIEPSLGRDCYGGYFTPSDATGDIHRFTRGLADACARRGVRFVMDADVQAIDRPGDGGYRLRVARGATQDGMTQDAAAVQRADTLSADTSTPAAARGDAGHDDVIQADAVVICAGVASRRFAAMLGDTVNIYPVKGYSITLDLDTDEGRAAAPWVSLLDESAKIVTSRLGANRLRVAGTAEFNGENRDIRADRIAPLVAWTRREFPGVPTHHVSPWAGLRPMMPDMMPRVSPGRLPGVFYNTGHGHLGWTLSAATAQILAAQVEAAVRAPRGTGAMGLPGHPVKA